MNWKSDSYGQRVSRNGSCPEFISEVDWEDYGWKKAKRKGRAGDADGA